jgi:hypothetical protein
MNINAIFVVDLVKCADVERETILMNQQEKNKALADDIKELLIKHGVIDTRIYFNNICYHFDSSGGVQTLEDIKPSKYFEYANDKTVSMSFEGALNHAINYGEYPTLMNEFDAVFEKHDCYYELGYAWSLSVYFD